MARVKQQNKGTSSADLAAKAEGYAPNGLSSFTRSSAQPRMRPSATERLTKQEASKCDLLIRRHMHELRKLERKIAVESDPTIAGKLVTQQEIKMRFIARLRREQIAVNEVIT
jgi:hypothetical protein